VLSDIADALRRAEDLLVLLGTEQEGLRSLRERLRNHGREAGCEHERAQLYGLGRRARGLDPERLEHELVESGARLQIGHRNHDMVEH